MKPKWPKARRDVQNSWILFNFPSRSCGLMDRASDYHPNDPGSIPGGAADIAIFSVKKNAKKVQHPYDINTCDFSIETEFEKILTPK